MFMPMTRKIERTSEHVGRGHPDKFADQLADRILDETQRMCGDDHGLRRSARTAIECLAKDNFVLVSGEVKWHEAARANLDVVGVVRRTWEDVYGTAADALTVVNHIRAQSPDIATGGAPTVAGGMPAAAGGVGTDEGGAGDQGIMVGYATDETPEMMPREWVMARDLCMALEARRRDGTLPWLRADCKSQVTLDAAGRVASVVIAAQHDESDAALDRATDKTSERAKQMIVEHVVRPVVGDDVPANRVKINGTGKFVIGGPTGDAGVVGRKIVVDAYGPRVPVGGGAYSGKDPTKVDRSAAYMARHIAKAVVAYKVRGARECLVQIAYGIGQLAPEMVTAVTDGGEDVSGWVMEKFAAKDRFKRLAPSAIIDGLGLRCPRGWSYYETAAYGHYGRRQFPWEAVDDGH